MHFQKSPQVLSVVCVPHLGRCYRGGHEHEPLRFLTTRRHVRVKARRCYYESRAPRDPASPDRCQPAPCRVAQSCPTLRPHGLQPASLLCVRDFPGENTGAGCHFLLQGIVLTQRLNLSFLHLSSVLAGGLFTMSATWEALPASG